VTIASDFYATFDRIRVGTREAMFPAAGATMDTAAIARDVLLPKASATASVSGDISPEFWWSQAAFGVTDTNTNVYQWGRDPTTGTGTAPNSGIGINGFSALEWQSAADVLASLAAVDGYHVGFYLPYNGRSGYDPPGAATVDVGSFWLSAPPQLYYQPFPDPNQSPDYTIHTREGAVITQTAAAQPLLDVLYANYQTIQGRPQSVVTVDTNLANYAYAQGFRRAEDYTIQPSVGDAAQGSALGQQYLAARRQPVAAATITIENDGASRYPILKAGAIVPKLALIRPGSVRIVDIAAASNLRAGYVTQVEWWGATVGSNEKVELSLAQPPGQVAAQRARGHLVARLLRSRTTKFGGGPHG
jgi:hypothetical protein